MSVIVGRLSKKMHASSAVDLRELWRRLPLPGEPEVRHFENGRAEVAIFDYGAAQEFEQIESPVGVRVFAQGTLTKEARSWLPEVLLSDASVADPISHPESISGAALAPDEIRIFTSCSGTDAFMYVESDEHWVFSNHHSPLGAFLESRPNLRSSALAWSLVKYHNMDFHHQIEGIERTRPGSVWVISSESTTEFPMHPHWEQLTEPIDKLELPEIINSAANSLSDYALGLPREKALSLSGGKDSRAILGLLGQNIYGRWLSLSTGGEVYSPDVMAASALTEIAGLSKQHYISQPPLISRPGDLAPQIANDLMTDCALSSLADIRPVTVRQSMVLGGHEYGTKGAQPHLELDQLFQRETDILQSSPFLTAEGRRALSSELLPDLEENLGEVPAEKMETAWKIKYRLPLLQGASITSRNAGASEMHPFLDYRLLRIVLGSAPEFTRSQAIHYFLNRRMDRPIENAPFANDTWPESLWPLLETYGLSWRGRPSAPFKFNPAFPSQSSFGRYNWRIELFKAMRPRVSEYLQDGTFDREFVEPQAMIDLTSRDPDTWSFENLYQLGSILKFCLINELGASALDAGNRANVEYIVRDFVGGEKHSVTSPAPKREDVLEDALTRANNAIRDLALQIQSSNDFAAPRISVLQALEFLSDGTLTTSQIEALIPAFGSADKLQKIPEEGRLDYSGRLDHQSRITIKGFLLKRPETTILVGFPMDSDLPVAGATLSPAGFHYFYVSPDDDGYFEKTLQFPTEIGNTQNFFVQRWFSPGDAFISLNAG